MITALQDLTPEISLFNLSHFIPVSPQRPQEKLLSDTEIDQLLNEKIYLKNWYFKIIDSQDTRTFGTKWIVCCGCVVDRYGKSIKNIETEEVISMITPRTFKTLDGIYSLVGDCDGLLNVMGLQMFQNGLTEDWKDCLSKILGLKQKNVIEEGDGKETTSGEMDVLAVDANPVEQVYGKVEKDTENISYDIVHKQFSKHSDDDMVPEPLDAASREAKVVKQDTKKKSKDVAKKETFNESDDDMVPEPLIAASREATVLKQDIKRKSKDVAKKENFNESDDDMVPEPLIAASREATVLKQDIKRKSKDVTKKETFNQSVDDMVPEPLDSASREAKVVKQDTKKKSKDVAKEETFNQSDDDMVPEPLIADSPEAKATKKVVKNTPKVVITKHNAKDTASPEAKVIKNVVKKTPKVIVKKHNVKESDVDENRKTSGSTKIPNSDKVKKVQKRTLELSDDDILTVATPQETKKRATKKSKPDSTANNPSDDDLINTNEKETLKTPKTSPKSKKPTKKLTTPAKPKKLSPTEKTPKMKVLVEIKSVPPVLGTTRSGRNVMKPLKWWENEKISV